MRRRSESGSELGLPVADSDSRVLIGPLAWELPYAASAAQKKGGGEGKRECKSYDKEHCRAYTVFFAPVFSKLFVVFCPNKTPKVDRPAVITSREVKQDPSHKAGSGHPHPPGSQTVCSFRGVAGSQLQVGVGVSLENCSGGRSGSLKASRTDRPAGVGRVGQRAVLSVTEAHTFVWGR